LIVIPRITFPMMAILAQRGSEKIATNILADRLEKLVEHGIAEKWISDDQPYREAYRLTSKGKTLNSVLESVANWGLKHLPGTEARMKPAISATVDADRK